MIAPLALYIHWPFCRSKCPYCDFNSHVAAQIDHVAWERAYRTELATMAKRMGARNVTSIFFGGGTPSLMPPALVSAILDAIRSEFSVDVECEITLEANPTSVEASRFEALAKAGINRLSIGVQSLREKDLKFLGREHDAAQAMEAIAAASASVPRYSFDLIYARPHQTLADWQDELQEALALAGGHLSLYQLTIEKGTPFYAAYQRGEFTLPDEDQAADLYEQTRHILSEAGYADYEVSNYAKPGHESRHNLAYWRYQEYLGIGPGAHSRIREQNTVKALMMRHAPDAWMKEVAEQGHGLQADDAVSMEDALKEKLLMNLRIQQGFSIATLSAEEKAAWARIFNTQKAELFITEGLLMNDAGILKATHSGRLVLNRLIADLVR